ncbi:hypothetical protein PHISP_04417 [Aspergillus sp. HF37]|nr:hypothetical protein PHISP_04417 [Aspergillus sp. HF37]
MAPTKPVLHPLKTPKSAVFPSELFNNDSSSTISDTVKHNDDMSTPITPPTAYTEFLKALTPVFNSPVSASMSFPSFPLDRPANSPGPTSQPASALGGSFTFNEPGKSAPATSLPPPTPNSAVGTARMGKTARGLRRLHIPQFSPAAESPRSATTIRSPFSPSDWKDWKVRHLDTPRSASGRPVSVRQVTTRTVTFKRTQLEDPPKGKKRRKRNEDPPKDT